MAETNFDPQKYTSPDGGKFGPGDSASYADAVKALESSTGVNASRFGDLSKMSPSEIDAYRKLMARIANGDTKAYQEGLQSSNPFIQQTAKAYLSGRGARGYDEETWNQYTQAQTDAQKLKDAQAASQAAWDAERSSREAAMRRSTTPGSYQGSGSGAAPPPPSAALPGQVAGAVGYNAQPSSPTQSALEQAVLAGLTGQGGYSQQLLEQMRSTGKQELMAQYQEAKRQLEGEMAKRGIAASSIALERSSGLMGQNQRALASFETDLAKQTEDALRSDRQNAISAALTLRGQQAQEGQFAQTFGLSVAQFNQQAAQWAQTFGLDQAKFAEATRQFNTSLAEQQRQFGLTYDLQSQQFKAQAAQWAAQFGLDQQKFYEAIRQFTASQTQQQKQFDTSTDLQRKQIITQIIQSLTGKIDQKTLEAIVASMGIDPKTIWPDTTTPPGAYVPKPNGVLP